MINRLVLRFRGRIFFNTLTALLAGGFCGFILSIFPFYPPGILWPVVGVITAAWLIKPEIGVFVNLVVFLLPVGFNSPSLALLYVLLFLLISIIEAGALSPVGFLILATMTLAALLPSGSFFLLAGPILAGFLGWRRGTILGAFSCFWVEILALLSGQSHIGPLLAGDQTSALITIQPQPISSLLDYRWLSQINENMTIDTGLLTKMFTPFLTHPVLLLQIGGWAITAGLVGLLLSRTKVVKISARISATTGGWLVLVTETLVFHEIFSQSGAGSSINPIDLLAPGAILIFTVLILERFSALRIFPLLSFINISSPSPHQAQQSTPPAHHKMFISYSSKDKGVVDIIRSSLETAGIICWIAPRDINPGEDFPTAIANAIAASRLMLLVFTQNSNLSEEVSREIYLAAQNKATIIPFRIEDVDPEPGKAYYLSRLQWQIGSNPPTGEQITKLQERIFST